MIRQNKDIEANAVLIELQKNNPCHKPTLQPHEPDSSYLGDGFPTGEIGYIQSTRVSSEQYVCHKRCEQHGKYGYDETDLSRAKLLV
jgi:hypothetical protein